MATVTSWGAALYASLAAALALVFSFVPKLIGFLVILLIGWFIASALARAVTFLLRRLNFDRIATRIGLARLEQQMGVRTDTADILGKIVYWFIFLIFLVPAVNALGLTTVSTLLEQVVGYLPNVFVAILVLFLGSLIATVVADLVRGATASAGVGNASLLSHIARYAILGFVVLIALEQLQIAPALLNILFTAIVGAAALTIGLAFGLGGRESAQRYLNRLEETATVTAAATQTPSLQRYSDQTPTANATDASRRREQNRPSFTDR